jgi:hypothetical protein
MIRVVHPGSGSRIWMLTFYPSRIPDPGVKKDPDPQHCFPGGDFQILRGLPEERREVGRGSLEEKLLVHLQVGNNPWYKEVEQ